MKLIIFLVFIFCVSFNNINAYKKDKNNNLSGGYDDGKIESKRETKNYETRLFEHGKLEEIWNKAKSVS